MFTRSSKLRHLIATAILLTTTIASALFPSPAQGQLFGGIGPLPNPNVGGLGPIGGIQPLPNPNVGGIGPTFPGGGIISPLPTPGVKLPQPIGPLPLPDPILPPLRPIDWIIEDLLPDPVRWEPIYATQTVINDVLPIAVIYQPPGQEGRQELLLTNRWGTSTTITEVVTSTQNFSFKAAINFLPLGKYEEKRTGTDEKSTREYQVFVDESGWDTWLNQAGTCEGGDEHGQWCLEDSHCLGGGSCRPEDWRTFYPGEGDVIAFYLNPRFEFRFEVGRKQVSGFPPVLLPGLPSGVEIYAKPKLVSITPYAGRCRGGQLPGAACVSDNDCVGELKADEHFEYGTCERDSDADVWVRRAATTREIRDRFANGSGLDEGVRSKLLELDPLTLAQPGYLYDHAGGFAPSPGELTADVARAAVETNPERFVFQQKSQWAACGTGEIASQQLLTGTQHSVTHKTSMDVKFSLPISFEIPIYKAIKLKISMEVGDRVVHEYSTNRVTEDEESTTATVRIGGGGDCGVDAPLYESDRYYDSTFGTILYLTDRVDATVRGELNYANGRPMAGEPLTFSRKGESSPLVHTVTDHAGHYGVRLDPGHYEVHFTSPSGAPETRTLVVGDDTGGIGQPIQIEPVRVDMPSVDGVDLTGWWESGPSLHCKGNGPRRRCRVRGELRVANEGTEMARRVRVGFRLSSDASLDDDDPALRKQVRVNLRPGQEQTKRVSLKLPGAATTGSSVFAVIDEVDHVAETDESNNLVVGILH